MEQTEVFNEIQDWVKGQGLDVELLVDVSGSMKQEKRLPQALEFARAAAQVGKPPDTVFFITRTTLSA